MKLIYFFGDGGADGSASDKNLLGGKGANLAEMTSLGIPVPPGFTICTKVCAHYMDTNELESDFRFDTGKVILGKGKPKIKILAETISVY